MLRILALQLALLVVLLGALEGAYRIALSARGEPWSAAAGRAHAQAVEEALFKVDWRAQAEEDEAAERKGKPARPQDVRPIDEKADIILHPYFGFDIAAGQDEYVDVARQLRNEKPEAAFDVLVVGGSVSCLFVQQARRRLIAELRKDPRLREIPIRIHSLGRGGYKQPQQLFIVCYALALGWRPEAVVNVDGFNELALSNYNATHGAHPFHPSLPHWAHLARGRSSSPAADELGLRMLLLRERVRTWLDTISRFGLLHSAVLGKLALRRLDSYRGQYASTYARYVDVAGEEGGLTVSGPPFKSDLPAVLRTAVTTWADCSRSLAAVCEAHGIVYLHVLQPTLHDPGSKPLSKQEWATSTADKSWVQACREGYPRLREAGKGLAALGIHFLDASLVFQDVEEDLYYDACHFQQPGSERLAVVVAAELTKLLP